MNTQIKDFIPVELRKYMNDKFIDLIIFSMYRMEAMAKYEDEWKELPPYEKKEIYDDSGYLIVEEYHRNEKLISCYSYIYDDNRDIVCVQFFDTFYDFEFYEYFFYDNRGRIIKSEFHDYEIDVCHEYDIKCNIVAASCNIYNDIFKPRIEFRSSCIYHNHNDRLLEQQYYGKNDELLWTVHYEYNQKGWLIEKNLYKKKVMFAKIVIDYDKNGHKTYSRSFIHKDCQKRLHAEISNEPKGMLRIMHCLENHPMRR
jgi:hypothetical protein